MTLSGVALFSRFEETAPSFFGFHRDPKCADSWRSLLDNMGGSMSLSFYSSAAFLLFRYQAAGHDLDAEMERITSRGSHKICPKCKSWKVAPILYGMPAMDADLKRALAKQELYIGECTLPVDGPDYHCHGFGSNFSRR